MEIPWKSIADWTIIFILSFFPAVHAIIMKARYGINTQGPRAILRVNLYDFGIMSSTAISVSGLWWFIPQL